MLPGGFPAIYLEEIGTKSGRYANSGSYSTTFRDALQELRTRYPGKRIMVYGVAGLLSGGYSRVLHAVRDHADDFLFEGILQRNRAQ